METSRCTEQRIVPEELWVAAHRRNAEANANGVSELRRTSPHGKQPQIPFQRPIAVWLVPLQHRDRRRRRNRGYVKYGCHTRKHTGVCENKLMIRRDRLETQLITALEEDSETEDVEYLFQRCEQELTRRLKELEVEGVNATQEY